MSTECHVATRSNQHNKRVGTRIRECVLLLEEETERAWITTENTFKSVDVSTYLGISVGVANFLLPGLAEGTPHLSTDSNGRLRLDPEDANVGKLNWFGRVRTSMGGFSQ